MVIPKTTTLKTCMLKLSGAVYATRDTVAATPIVPRHDFMSIDQWPLNGGVSNGGVSRSGLVCPFLSFFVLFCPFLSFFVLFCPFWDFPDFSGIFLICSGMVRGISRLVLFLFLGLLRAPTRNSPERVRDTIWTFPKKKGKHPGLETPRFSFSQIECKLEVRQPHPKRVRQGLL